MTLTIDAGSNKKSSAKNDNNHIKDESSSAVQVAVRVRPLLPSEAGSTQCIDCLYSSNRNNSSNTSRNNERPCVVRIGGESGPTFQFDESFPGTTSQKCVYDTRVHPLVMSCLQGYNATVLAYGQTGSGKTHTIMGANATGGSTNTMNGGSSSSVVGSEDELGVIPRALRSLFDQLEETRNRLMKESDCTGTANRNNNNNNPAYDDIDNDEGSPYEYEVQVQFLELYGEEIRDLLSPQQQHQHKGLSIRDIGTQEEPEVIGATKHKVSSAEEALLFLARGMLRRVTGATAMNASSSRSHAILSVLIEQTTSIDTTKEESNSISTSGQQHKHIEVKRSKFNFVDLAGSERQKRTKASGQRLREGIDINKGLLVLGNVISALGDPSKRAAKTFVPYRDSKLTRLLKGSLGGNHKTLMIACVSPSSNNLEESINCLRYANRAKNIQNNAIVNVDEGSKVVSELRSQIQILANELLRLKDPNYKDNGNSGTSGPFTLEMLRSLASGTDSEGCITLGGDNNGNKRVVVNHHSTRGVESSPPSLNGGWEEDDHNDGGKREFESGKETRYAHTITTAADTENELCRLRERLRCTERKLLSTEEELLETKAEREFYRLKSPTKKNSHHHSPASGNDATTIDEDDAQTVAFLRKVTEYEREIATLRKSLCESQQVGGTISSKHEEGAHVSSVIERATRVISEEKEEFANIRRELDMGEYNDDDNDNDDAEFNSLRSAVLNSISPEAQLDAEEAAEQEQMTSITNKYLESCDELDEDDIRYEENDEGKVAHQQQEEPNEQEESNETFRHRLQIEAHLTELSKSIESKEELIEQLQLSQQKYATMREFYEDKIQQMENQVKSKEMEREQLVVELKQMEETNSCTKDLQDRLKTKEDQIANLRKKQNELKGLTKVSARNENEIGRLRNEVVSMKQRKVELQKQISTERKRHSAEIQQLKKNAISKEKEAAKWKKVSEKKSIEAEKAQQVAKNRLNEVGQLRMKYKEAEKKLRMKTVKRVTMENAGLDAVLTGRRSSNRNRGNIAKSRTKKSCEESISVDSVRDYLDTKVAEIGRKEQIAEKLAREWEEHLELQTRKEELSPQDGGHLGAAAKEEIESINVQLQYKEGRIRQLACRIGKRPASMESDINGDSSVQTPSVFDEKEFKALYAGSSEADAAKITSKILLGMVVRERRRVAALARTASALDAKVVEAEDAVVAKDAAFRSYKEEERHERAMLAQTQQEQILSLMGLVQQEDTAVLGETKVSTGGPDGTANSTANHSLLVLANERVSVLERQLDELQGDRESMETYKSKDAKNTLLLEEREKECAKKDEELDNFRSTLREIREAVWRIDNRKIDKRADSRADSSYAIDTDRDYEIILDLVMQALHPRSTNSSPSNRTRRSKTRHKELAEGSRPTLEANGISSPLNDNALTLDSKRKARNRNKSDKLHPPLLSPTVKQLIHSSDSEDEDVPDWAQDIMRDLAAVTTAMDEIAQSKEKSKSSKTATSSAADTERGNVFDRLTDPGNFTGVQKTNSAFKKRRNRRKVQAPKIDPTTNTIDKKSSFDAAGSTTGTITDKRQVNTQSIRNSSSIETEQSANNEYFLQQQTDDSVIKAPLSNSSAAVVGFAESSVDQNNNQYAISADHQTTDELNQDTMNNDTEYSQQQQQQYENADYDSEASSLLDDLLSSEVEEQHHQHNNNNNNNNNLFYTEKMTNYTKQNVFERLQKTTTHSYAKKHNDPILKYPASAHNIISSSTTTSTSQQQQQQQQQQKNDHHYSSVIMSQQQQQQAVSPPPEAVSSCTTTTEDQTTRTTSSPEKYSYNNNHHHHPAIGGASAHDQTVGGDGSNNNSSNYVEQDVFERLTKTTTQAYAGKKTTNVPNNNNNDNNNSSNSSKSFLEQLRKSTKR